LLPDFVQETISFHDHQKQLNVMAPGMRLPTAEEMARGDYIKDYFGNREIDLETALLLAGLFQRALVEGEVPDPDSRLEKAKKAFRKACQKVGINPPNPNLRRRIKKKIGGPLTRLKEKVFGKGAEYEAFWAAHE